MDENGLKGKFPFPRRISTIVFTSLLLVKENFLFSRFTPSNLFIMHLFN